jgi:hypothetical protein
MIVHHRPHRIARLLAAGVVAGALAAPTAFASPASEPGSVNDPGTTESPVVVRTVDDGFDWGSAAIGAGTGGAVIVLVSLGGFAYISRARVHAAR